MLTRRAALGTAAAFAITPDVATASDLYIDMSLANEDWQPGGNTPWGSNNGGE